MSYSEFAIIEKYFKDSGLCFVGEGVDLAIGDDCALVSIDENQQLAMSMDLLQEGVHFPLNAVPELLGQRALAVNLSDLAAVGAEPMCFTLGLSLPEADEPWLEAFSAGLSKMAERFNCPLVGGDLIRGNLQIAIQVQGRVPKGGALLRSSARPGHLVYVTGTLGDAAAALGLFDHLDNGKAGKGRVKGRKDKDSKEKDSKEKGKQEKGKEKQDIQSFFVKTKLATRHRNHLINAFYCPEPRISVGMAIRGQASAAIDISDGLLSDLGHIVTASGVGAELDIPQLPLSDAMLECVVEDQRTALALIGGDDYELCFTVPPENCQAVEKAVAALGVPLTRVGEIVTGEGVQCLDSFGEPMVLKHAGYTHFSGDSL